MQKSASKWLTTFFLFFFSLFNPVFSSYLSLDPSPHQINSVRFDPSYYYDSELEIQDMAEALISQWKKNGINTIFYKVYDPIYGAKYKTDYPFNIVADYGKQDLLSYILSAAKKNDMQIIAWIPAFLHKSAWEAHPEWRTKNNDNTDYQPNPEDFFLCAANDNVRTWWLGFIKDILDNYPDLDGVDIAEPIIKWNDHRCYCDQCIQSAEPLFSSEGLTQTLNESVELINSYNKISCITSVITAGQNGKVFSKKEQQLKSGVDLDGILDHNSPPDWINLEIMWQQWADHFNAANIFTPEWVFEASKSIINLVDYRSILIAHLEQTSFGEIQVDPNQLADAIHFAKDAGIEHIDIYDTHLLDELDAWNIIKPELEYIPLKKILVLTDPNGENDAKQIVSLLSHFKTKVDLVILNEDTPTLLNIDSVKTMFYIGIDSKFKIPRNILSTLHDFSGDICWINYGVEQFIEQTGDKNPGFNVKAIRHDSLYQTVPFKGYNLPRFDPSFVETEITDSTRSRVLVEMIGDQGSLPYVIKSKNLWYFCDLPTAFVTEGGRHIVISDMLHDILHEDHIPKKLALIRIEDIHPISDVDALSKVTNYLDSQNTMYSIGIVPFYLDPESNVTATLNDMPKFKEFIQKAEKSGATIIMHGSTHQFRGETTADYEFWDGMTEEKLFSDSKEYVRQKLLSGLHAFSENQIYPLIWETPHYAASQMDYGIINTFFSTAYERRQTIDKHGSDQLLPYLIYDHTAGSKIIPENLGYVPLDNPDPAPLLRAAENNLAIRDGVASFFFHTFVDHNALKTLIPGLKKLGYTFTSPKYTANQVKAPNYQAITGSGTLELTLENEYYHEFFIDDKGHKKEQVYSDTTLNETITKFVQVPEGWIFIAEKLQDKPKGLFQRVMNSVIPSVPELSQTIFNSDPKSLIDANAFPISAAILVDSTAVGRNAVSQSNLIKSMQVVGLDIQILDITTLVELPDDINMLIVPQATAGRLTEQQNLFIAYALQNGLNVVFEKHSNITQNLGIVELEQETVIADVIDEYYPGVTIKWKEPDTLKAFDVDIDYVSYYSVAESGEPVVIGGEYGQGKYLFFATLFDPVTDYGYARYPYFIDLLQRQFNLVPTIRRNTVEIYFEPGDREDISVEELVKMWRNFGVRRIYVSAWHFYEAYTYDYERLINLAHQNAMLVYAWLEIPHVSQKFWEEHPEWREKTATGIDAMIDWRHNMAVDLPECRQAIYDVLEQALLKYDWDGINFAELYYESQLSYNEPSRFTPMNEYIRQLFEEKYNYDPILLFSSNSPYYWNKNKTAREQLYQFREDRIYYLHGEFLKFMYELKDANNKEWEIMVTTLENIFSPDIGRATATNTKRILQWVKQYPFTIQIEDPMPLWSLGPERYTKIIKEYSDLDYDKELILDINVVPWRNQKVTKAPTAQPTGLELYQLAKAAGAENTRVAIYSEASLYEIDFPMLTYVFANSTREKINNNEWIIETPNTINALLDVDSHNDILLNGMVWPAYYNGRVIIPAGLHKIQPISRLNGFIKKFKADVRLVDLSAELIDAHSISRGIEFTYNSDVSNIVVLTEKPIDIYINDDPIEFSSHKGDQGYSIRLPHGKNKATIYTQTNGTQTLKYTSVVISGMIVILGILAGLFLSAMYLQNTIRRKRASV